jgi:hypothetical protein
MVNFNIKNVVSKIFLFKIVKNRADTIKGESINLLTTRTSHTRVGFLSNMSLMVVCILSIFSTVIGQEL